MKIAIEIASCARSTSSSPAGPSPEVIPLLLAGNLVKALEPVILRSAATKNPSFASLLPCLLAIFLLTQY